MIYEFLSMYRLLIHEVSLFTTRCNPLLKIRFSLLFIFILSWYSVIAGWTLSYIVKSASGVFVGASPAEVVAVLAKAAEEIVASDEFEAFMTENKFGVAIRQGDDFTAFLSDQDELWKPVIEAAGYAR